MTVTFCVNWGAGCPLTVCVLVPLLKELQAKPVRTYSPKPADADKKWYVIDASDEVLGRLAAQVAILLRGKHKPSFAPHMDMGDYVIIVNAEKIVLTGNKLDQKMAYHHSGYPGGMKETPYRELMEKYPERILEKAIRGMLPHNSIGRDQARKLHVYAGPNHPHAAQMPVPYEIKQVAQ